MPQDPSTHPPLFEVESPPGADPELRAEAEKRTALVHVLTPDFHDLDPAVFGDIAEDVVARASAQELQGSLFWRYVPKGLRREPEVSAFSYQTPGEGFVSVALTPQEYDTASESVEKLGQRVFSKVLVQRDAALQKETGNPAARARSDEDLRVANRGSVRAVMDQQDAMQHLLDDSIVPKIELIERFIKMTEGRNPNLSRGTRESVSRRFEELRTTIFDDMLDAVALQRGWDAGMTERAKQVIQKRLYISGTTRQRVANFKEMLALAHSYYGYKRALILTKIHEARKYQRERPEVVADIMAIDEERRREKEAKQLQLDDA